MRKKEWESTKEDKLWMITEGAVIVLLLALLVGWIIYSDAKTKRLLGPNYKKIMKNCGYVERLIDPAQKVRAHAKSVAFDTLTTTTKIECVKSVVNNHCLQNLQQK